MADWSPVGSRKCCVLHAGQPLPDLLIYKEEPLYSSNNGYHYSTCLHCNQKGGSCASSETLKPETAGREMGSDFTGVHSIETLARESTENSHASC
eukprot:scaffold274500_cov19-Prasinocladus_malaysianus.AAC.1